ncbi:MAG: zf-HC2 domain-containing protein [Acidimicrobiales bacterium]
MRRFLRRLIARPAEGHGTVDCVAVGQVLQRYLDGATDAETTTLVAAHLDDCLRCGLEADTYRRIKAALAHHRQPPPPDAVQRLREFGLQLARGEGGPRPGSV